MCQDAGIYCFISIVQTLLAHSPRILVGLVAIIWYLDFPSTYQSGKYRESIRVLPSPISRQGTFTVFRLTRCANTRLGTNNRIPKSKPISVSFHTFVSLYHTLCIRGTTQIVRIFLDPFIYGISHSFAVFYKLLDCVRIMKNFSTFVFRIFGNSCECFPMQN